MRIQNRGEMMPCNILYVGTNPHGVTEQTTIFMCSVMRTP